MTVHTAYDPTWRRLTAWLQRTRWHYRLDRADRALVLRAWHETEPAMRSAVVQWAMSVPQPEADSPQEGTVLPPTLSSSAPPLLVALYALCDIAGDSWKAPVLLHKATPDYVLRWLAQEGTAFLTCAPWLAAVARHPNVENRTLAFLRKLCVADFGVWHAVDIAQRKRSTGPYTPQRRSHRPRRGTTSG